MAEFTRPPGFHFTFLGVNTRDVPDALQTDKYAAAQDIRRLGMNSIRTRPGYDPFFTTGGNGITDLRAYTALNTDSKPRYLARDSTGKIWLDNGVSVGNLTGNAGFGASLVPFRPAEDARAWMYISSAGDYQRFSSPDAGNNVTQAKVGIAEPQTQVEACASGPRFEDLGPFGGDWSVSGNNSSAPSFGTITSETAGTVLADPVLVNHLSVQVSGNNAYALWETLVFNNATTALIQDVIPAFAAGGSVTIQSIRYRTGVTGLCTIVIGQIPLQSNVEDRVVGLRRGALVRLGGTETVLVRDIIVGPTGIVAFEATTVGTFAAGAAVIGLPAIVVSGNTTDIAAGKTIVKSGTSTNLNTGLSTFTKPFTTEFQLVSGLPPQQDDYLHLSIQLSDPTALNEVLILFQLGGNNSNLLYYAVRPGDLVQVLSGNQAVLPAILSAAEAQIIANLNTGIQAPDQTEGGNNQWSSLLFPISSLTRLGNDLTKTLSFCTGVQLQVNLNNNATFIFSSLWLGAGFPPDVGNNGTPYKYQCVPFSSTTGVRGNPTPVMRYGVGPRRQQVVVQTSVLDTTYDTQIDTWEIYRFGGTITSYRFIGTVPVGTDFIDSFFDDSAAAGNEIVVDNTEPWPTIDQPYKLIAGGSNNITAFGQFLVVGSPSFPSTLPRWLPGTIVAVGDQEAFTLRSRPVNLGNNNFLLEFDECVGSNSQTALVVLEPNVARQTFPYVWGPDAYGFLFGCGDPFRAGSVSWTKPNTPDAVPTAYNAELCPPSEPLLGGEIVNGVSYAASSKRWWTLNFQGGNTGKLYEPVEAPIGKRLIAPFGHCTDGSRIYFWAEDGIVASEGGAAKSLTDTDLYNLFPHGQISGRNITRGGVTFYAPDYSQAATFRLSVKGGELFALYKDSGGTARTLVCDLSTIGWSSDKYADSITVIYAVEQPKGTLQTAPAAFEDVVMADAAGKVWKAKDLTNDGGNAIGVPISPIVYTREWDGDDLRANEFWGDQYLDVLAPNNMNVTPFSGGNGVAPSTLVPANNNRQFTPISLAGGKLVNFLGLLLAWTDNFNTSTIATTLYAWQPSFVEKPEITGDRFSDYTDFGSAQYVRGVSIRADTFGANKNLSFRNSDSGNLVQPQGGPASGVINHNGEQEIQYVFNPPFISHMVRDEPQDLVPWRRFSMQWIKDPWPSFTKLPSAWMNLGQEGAKYLRGAVLPMDTGGNNVTLTLISSDGGNNVSMSPFNTPAAEKTSAPFAFTTPLIGHEFQIVPQNNVRIWYEEILWLFDPWPELIAEASPWMNLGDKGAKYVRGAVIPVDTNGNAVSLTFLSSDGGNVTVGPFTTPASEKTSVPWPFSVPLIGHEFQLVPSGKVRVWYEEIRWDVDPWPELIAEASPWLNMGTPGAKYLRGAVIPLDTGNNNVSITFRSSDGNSVSLPALTPASNKTPVPFAFSIPLVGHEFQLIPTPANSVRIWWDEIRWDFNPWPELISEATGWMPVLPGGGAAFLQGFVLPVETGGAAPALQLLTDTGLTIGLTATVVPLNKLKTGVAYSLASPTICHQVQLLPLQPCRIWIEEIQWIAQPTPELATTWSTQWTALGAKGYKHIPRVEAAYSASLPVTLSIAAFDGISPQSVTLPATGNNTQRLLTTLTLNKGQLYQFSAVSAGTFQIFANDFIVWVAEWGRQSAAVPYTILGAPFGDKATI